MTTSEFDNYKVDHLFLLIGENPLPNYVAARTLRSARVVEYQKTAFPQVWQFSREINNVINDNLWDK